VFQFSRLRLHHAVVRIAICAIGVRLAAAVLALVATVVFPMHRDQELALAGTAGPLWDAVTRYDSGASLQIARAGYRAAPAIGSPVPFPVQPLLMRYVGRAFGRSAAALSLGGVLVSWTAFVAAMIALYFLARLDLTRGDAEQAGLFAALFPFALFLGVASPDSVYLLLAVLTFYCVRTRRWIAGGLCGACAAASSASAVLMLPALMWAAVRERESRDRLRAAFGVTLVVCGAAASWLIVSRLTAAIGEGRPYLEWAAAMMRIGGERGGPSGLTPFAFVQRLTTHPYALVASDRLAPYRALSAVAGLFVLVTVPLVWRRFGGVFGLFVLVNVGVAFAVGSVDAVGRSCAVLFPTFIWLASLRSRTVSTALCVACAASYTICLIIY
jgi:hypothetical protein